jgi:hypothetical protein
VIADEHRDDEAEDLLARPEAVEQHQRAVRRR